MEKITAVIVDDEPEARELMKSLLSDFSDVEVVAANENVDKALISITNLKPDLLFLDIDMPGKNGFDLLHELKSFALHPTIIFVTAYNQFAIQAIKHAAFDYLVKPVDIDDLKSTIDRFKGDHQSVSSLKRIENLLQNLQDDKLRFSTRSGFIFISAADIVYCQAEGNYTDLHFANGEKQTITVNVGRLDGQLSSSKFTRISRSLIINQHYLAEVRRKDKLCILRVNDRVIELPVSSKFLNNLFI
jgi:DNA-binding LytR/AlgR family response regulator